MVGWAGSILLVWSLMEARMMRLRVLNLIASLILVGYNAALGVWPMVAMNVAVALIDIYHIVRLRREAGVATGDAKA
jgi:hypothetical protein